MSHSVSAALALIDARLDELHASMTDEPVEVVTERYRTWKAATRAVLADFVVEAAVLRFDRAAGSPNGRDHGRPTPPVYLDGAASRACLMAMKKDLAADPGAVLREPLSGPPQTRSQAGILEVVGLLEHRLPRAFRGRPAEERDLHNGFEALLAGAGIAYERGRVSIVYSSRTYVPDFTFPDLQAALELKLCDRPDGQEDIIAEVKDEIPACRNQYPHIIVGVYDLGFMRDPDGFSRALAQDGVEVRVVRP